MNRWITWLAWACFGLLLWPLHCPAPLVYTPGEGWRYEKVGEEPWQRQRAQDQFDIAQQAFEQENYGLALKAARRTVHVWPYSDQAPDAQYLIARCYEAKNKDEKAFKAYQRIIERYPKLDKFDEINQRQFTIANAHLAGKAFKLWGLVPWFPSMAKTIEMYEQIVKNGRHSEVAPQAQMNVGIAYQSKKFLWAKTPDNNLAAKAYEVAADRYSDKPIGADALFQAGLAYSKLARTAEYDQSVAGQAIATFHDFSILHPNDPRVDEAQEHIKSLRVEQARGSLQVARFYEKQRRWQGALIYYNEVLNLLLQHPESQYAEQARLRIDAINKRVSR